LSYVLSHGDIYRYSKRSERAIYSIAVQRTLSSRLATPFEMVSLIMQVLVFNVTLVVAWKVLRWLFVKSPLERIPGPPALSFIGGRSNDFRVMATFLLSF